MVVVLIFMGKLLQFISVIFLGALKMLVAPALAYSYKFSYIETFIATAVGGIIGVFFFVYFSEKLWSIREKLRKKDRSKREKLPKEKSAIVRFVINKWGYYGMVTILPGILWLPITSLLVVRLYGNTRRSAVLMSVSVAFWAALWAHLFEIGFDLFDIL